MRGSLSHMGQLHASSSPVVCNRDGSMFCSQYVSGRDEVMMGPMQQGPFPRRGGLGAEAVVELRQKRKAREVD